MNEPLFPCTNALQTPNPPFWTTKTAVPKFPQNGGSTPTPCLDKAAHAQGRGGGVASWEPLWPCIQYFIHFFVAYGCLESACFPLLFSYLLLLLFLCLFSRGAQLSFLRLRLHLFSSFDVLAQQAMRPLLPPTCMFVPPNPKTSLCA